LRDGFVEVGHALDWAYKQIASSKAATDVNPGLQMSERHARLLAA
jgi:hypothetical protein